jgi:hypothetical protein
LCRRLGRDLLTSSENRTASVGGCELGELFGDGQLTERFVGHLIVTSRNMSEQRLAGPSASIGFVVG